MINEERQLGRAKNAVLSFLEQRLSVPKIYLDANWDGHAVDVLAIDRDGVGDVHVALIFTRPFLSDGRLDVPLLERALDSMLDQFAGIPAQYKYIAAVDADPKEQSAVFGIPHHAIDKSFSADGVGRVGFLMIDAPLDAEPRTTIGFKPERFRAKIAKLADEYIEQHTADWELRA